jgi:hypothetical protein
MKMYYCVWKMVNGVRWRGQTIYECEICRFGYLELETAERCEQYCYSHEKPSTKNNTESHPEAICSSRPHRGISNDETLLNHADKMVRTTRTTQEKTMDPYGDVASPFLVVLRASLLITM